MCRSKHVEQLRNIGIINSTTRSHLVGYLYKIPNTSPVSTFTKQKTVELKIKDDIKFLYMKKEKLRNALYTVH